MIVGGLVAIGVADDRLLAVAAGPAGLLDDAVAGGDDRRADRALPSRRRYASGHSRGSDAGGAPKPERNLPVGSGLRSRNCLALRAVLVEIVDACRPASGSGRNCACCRRRSPRRRAVRNSSDSLVVAVRLREEDLDAVRRVEPRLEVDVGGQQLDQLLGHASSTCRRNRRRGRCRHRRSADCRAPPPARRIVEGRQQFGIGLRLLRRHDTGRDRRARW